MIIVALVVLGVATNFWHSYRSQQAVDRLRTSVMPTATARRDGAWQEIPLREVVPGDVFRLSAGDVVPADARLLESRDPFIQQSMLTGESLPAEKMVAPGAADRGTGPGAAHLIFLGTSVVSGTATALAEATGPRTFWATSASAWRAASLRRNSNKASGVSAC